MLNPSHLRTLLVVLQQGSFAAAANRLGYTPSAVSQQISALEAAVGVTLFDRGARHVRPTGAAQVMARHATLVLAELDSLQEAVRSDPGVAGVERTELRVSVYPSLVAPLAPFVSRFADGDDPSRRLRLSVRDPSLSVKALVEGDEIDVSVIYRVENTGLNWPRALQSVAVGEDSYVFVVPRAWGVHHGGSTSTEALTNRPWVMHHKGSSDSDVIESLFAAHRLQPQVVARADDFTVSLQLATQGFAGAFMPRVALGTLPPEAVVLQVPEVRLTRTVWALVSPSAPPTATREFISALQEVHELAHDSV